jgi:hypothetical protein
MRQEHEAAVSRGLIPEESGASRAPRRPSLEPKPRPERSAGPPRLKVVWQVCDLGGRTVATYAYTQKDEAEAHAASLKTQGKGKHFVRSEKVPMG